MRLSFSSVIVPAVTSLFLLFPCSEAADTETDATTTTAWKPATATWYGDVYGAGSEGKM